MAATRRGQRRLIDHIGKVGTHHPGRGRGQAIELDVVRQRYRPGVHVEDLAAPHRVRWLDRHAAIKPAGTQKRRVEHLRAIRGADHDNPGRRVEPVHLGEDLVERLLALVVSTPEPADRPRA